MHVFSSLYCISLQITNPYITYNQTQPLVAAAGNGNAVKLEHFQLALWWCIWWCLLISIYRRAQKTWNTHLLVRLHLQYNFSLRMVNEDIWGLFFILSTWAVRQNSMEIMHNCSCEFEMSLCMITLHLPVCNHTVLMHKNGAAVPTRSIIENYILLYRVWPKHKGNRDVLYDQISWALVQM